MTLKHRSGRNSRGVTQFEGTAVGRLIETPQFEIDRQKAVFFLRRIITISSGEKTGTGGEDGARPRFHDSSRCSSFALILDGQADGIHLTQSRLPTFFSTAFFSTGCSWLGPILTVSFSSVPVKWKGHA